MAFYHQPQAHRFTADHPVEMHFHDHDETWIVVAGRAKAFMVDRDGTRSEFDIVAGDIWMVEAGVEHGCDPDPQTGVRIFLFPGTIPEGSHRPGHYDMEKEGYMPTLVVSKTPLERHGKEP